MLIGLPLELSGDFVPVCSQTRDSVGVTVQGVVELLNLQEQMVQIPVVGFGIQIVDSHLYL